MKKICHIEKNWTSLERFPWGTTLESKWQVCLPALVWKISLTFIVIPTRVSKGISQCPCRESDNWNYIENGRRGRGGKEEGKQGAGSPRWERELF